MKMQDIPQIERPREKLEKYGPEKLSNSELLAILLRTGTRHANAVELSARILKKFSNKNLAEISFRELQVTDGIGKAKASEIIACFEPGKRVLQNKKAALVLTPHDIWQELRDIRDSKKEHFVVFYLDARNQEVQREVVSIGTLNTSLVHPREVFESAIKHSAAHIIIAHNHPSGNVTPSSEDVEVTKRLVEAGNILGIALMDHIIVSKSGQLSFGQKNLL